MAVQQLQHAHGTSVVPSDTLYLYQSLGYPYRVSSALFVGVGGNVRVLTEGGDDVVFSSVPDGTFMPVHVVKVFATGTTASSIVAVDLSNLSPFIGLLDAYSGAAAAYSLRQLSSTYTGSAIRVRRSSDNTEQDIGFASNELDVTALASFCSGTNGFVTTWYDQSGNGRNATQTTAADQPQIVSSGSVILENTKPAIKFLSNKLETTIFTSTSQPITRMFVGKSIIATNDFIDGSASNRGFTGNNAGINRLFAGTIFDTGTFLTTQQLFYGLFNGASSEIIVNGVSQGIGDSGTGGLDQVILGSHPIVRTVDLDGTMQEAIVYASNQNSNSSGIFSNINDFYSIY